MVDISRALTSTNHVSKFAPDVRLPYIIEVKVTAEQMIAAKGSALADADVFDLLRIPAGSVIKNVWLKKTKAFAGTSTDLTIDIGIGGGTTNYYVSAFDFDGAAVGTIAPAAAGVIAVAPGLVASTAGLVSLEIETMTGTWTSGSFTIYAEVLDLNDSAPSAGIVALGS